MSEKFLYSGNETTADGVENMRPNFNAGSVRIQKFISEFSVPFTQPYDFDKLIDNALYKLRDFTDTDRAIILESQPDGSLLCSYENVINSETPKVRGRYLAYETMKPILDEAEKTGCFYEKAAFFYFCKHPATDLGEKSFCYIPLMVEGERAGYLAFATIFEQANWAEGEFRLATMAGSILAGAFSMRNAQNALKEATLTAQKANIAKSLFLSNMSHEIRTPMNAILGMTQIASKTSDINKLKKCIETIEVSSNQLLSIINDVLDISKIESGKLELTETVFSLERTIMKSCALIATNANEKGIKVHICANDNLRVRYLGDDVRISQILANLLSNAVKFTPKGGAITLTAEEAAQPDNSKVLIRISVKDTGIGMNEDQLLRVFNSFEQADGSISRQYGGTGLGLAITKNLTEKMGGTVEVESAHGKGSKFTVNLLLGRADKDEADVYSTVKSQFADLGVLLISDELSVVARLTNIIRRFGVSCDVAKNCADAISQINVAGSYGHSYSAVFIDFSQQRCEALECFPQIGQLVTRDAIVFITEYGAWDSLSDKIEKYGVKRYLEMPLFASSIYDILTSIVYDKETNGLSMFADNALNLSNVTILLAEDLEINRITFLALLEETGIQVECAENGRSAIEMFHKSPDKYDMILMDVQMPQINGLDATRAIRSLNTPRARTIPIIAMTANAFKEDANECLAAGMNDHLAKPIEFNDLQRVLKEWLPESKCKAAEKIAPAAISDNEGLSRFRGNKKLYGKALLEFMNILAYNWPDFAEAAGDIRELSGIVHKIKGAAGSLCEKDIYLSAVKLESSLRGNSPNEALYEDFTRLCGSAKKRIREYLAVQTGDKKPKETGNKEEFSLLISNLRTAFDNYDLVASNNALATLNAKSWPQADEAKLRHICSLAEEYEFDCALEALDAMAVEMDLVKE